MKNTDEVLAEYINDNEKIRFPERSLKYKPVAENVIRLRRSGMAVTYESVKFFDTACCVGS